MFLLHHHNLYNFWIWFALFWRTARSIRYFNFYISRTHLAHIYQQYKCISVVYMHIFWKKMNRVYSYTHIDMYVFVCIINYPHVSIYIYLCIFMVILLVERNRFFFFKSKIVYNLLLYKNKYTHKICSYQCYIRACICTTKKHNIHKVIIIQILYVLLHSNMFKCFKIHIHTHT